MKYNQLFSIPSYTKQNRAYLLVICVGICRASHRFHECETSPFFGGSGRKAVIQTRPASQKFLGSRRPFRKTGCLIRQAINLASPRTVGAGRDGYLSLKDAGLDAPDMNASFSESMLDRLDQLPMEQGHTQPTQPTEVCPDYLCVNLQLTFNRCV